MTVQNVPEKDQLFLTAENCDELRAEVEAIQMWSHARGESPLKIAIDCNLTPGLKTLDIAPLIPSRPKAIYGKSSAFHGPNCYNTTLFENRLNQFQRHTDTTEWYTHLIYNCEKRAYQESPQPGDVVVINQKTGFATYASIHGFTYIRSLAFSKNGKGAANQPTLQLFKSVLADYGVTNSEKCIHPEKTIPEDCDRFVNFYTCKNRVNLDEWADLSQTEALISQATLYGDLSKFQKIKKKLKKAPLNAQPNTRQEHIYKATLTSFRIQAQELEFEKYYEAILENPLIDLNEIRTLVNTSSQNLIHAAAERNDLKRLRILLDRTYLNPDQRDGVNDTPLIAAAKSGHLEAVTALINTHRVNINHSNREGWNALLYAAHFGHLNVVQELLKSRETEVNIRHTTQATPLYFAAKNGHTQVIQELLNHPDIQPNLPNSIGATPLIIATFEKKAESVKALLKHPKTDVNQLTYAGASALIYAAHSGHLEIVIYLVLHGANPEIISSGYTPLALAVKFGHYSVAEFLLKFGKASPYFRTPEGKTLFELAEQSPMANSKQLKSLIQNYLK